MNDENNRPTFNDSMNDWVARKNRLNRRFRSRIFTPHPDRPVGQRIIGYLFRIIVFLAILFGIFQFLLKGYLKGADFSEDVSEAAQDYFHAESAKFTSFNWKGPDAVSKRFDALGGPQSFFRNVQASMIRANVPKEKVLKNDWNLDWVQMETVDLALKSGMATKTAASPNQIDWMVAGLGYHFGIKPTFKDLAINKLSAEKADINWGLSEVTSGALEGARATVLFKGEEGRHIEFAGGLLSQNWLKQLPLESAMLVQKSGLLEVDAKLDFPVEKGVEVKRFGTIKGDVKLAIAPRLDLRVDVQNIAVQALLPEELHPIFNGDVNMKANIIGSTNTSAGVIFEGDVECVSTKILKLELFKTINYVTSNAKFRQLATTGTFQFRSGQRKLEMKDINLQGGDLVRITGNVDYILPELEVDDDLIQLAEEPGMQAVGESDDEEESEDEEAAPIVPVLMGEIRFGIAESVVNEIPKGKEVFFKESKGGFYWKTMDLSGITMEEFTKEFADEIAKAFRDERTGQ